MDGITEDNVFAPGYGEFHARAKDELVTLALALPVDAAAGAPPADLVDLTDGARASGEAVAAGRWAAARDRGVVAGDVATLQVLWDRAGHAVNPASAERLTAGLEALGKAVGAEDLEAAAAAVPALRDVLGRVKA
jgi:hypothetical protein